jgi:hypothetical protein
MHGLLVLACDEKIYLIHDLGDLQYKYYVEWPSKLPTQ